jgi:hypothetical protein
MLYETLKWPQIAPVCISSKIIMACALLSLIYAPDYGPRVELSGIPLKYKSQSDWLKYLWMPFNECH